MSSKARKMVGKSIIALVASLLFFCRAGMAAEDEFADSLSSDTIYRYAVEALENKGWERARNALEKWLEREKPTAEALVFLGQARLYLKDEKDAEKSFNAALKIDKNNIEALEGLCEVYLIRDKKKEMVRTVKKLKSASKESHKSLYFEALAVDRFELEDYPETFFWDTLEELVRSEPTDHNTLNVLCDAYINDEFLERGILFLTELQDMTGEQPVYFFQLARI